MTKFLSGCVVCKKSPRPFSPSKFDDTCTESSTEFDFLNTASDSSTVSKIEEHELKDPETINLTVDWEENLEASKIEKIEIVPSRIPPIDEKNYVKNIEFSNELLKYYQLLNTFYSNTNQDEGMKKSENISTKKSELSSFRKIRPQPATTQLSREEGQSVIDLTISKSPTPDSTDTIKNININIEKSNDKKIDSSNFSINVTSNNSNINEFKISCKTSTPPKKRYNFYLNEAASCSKNLNSPFDLEKECLAGSVAKVEEEIQYVKKEEPSSCSDGLTVKPITSTYLQLTRSMGLTDEDALKIDDVVVSSFFY